jgi:hypothetical protein
MMHDDDFDDLDRMLAALPLEEPPARLHARILTATVFRPVPAVRSWELWLIATLVAVATWMTWVLASSPNFGERVTDLSARIIQAGGLDSLSTAIWLVAGVSAAWWISQMSFPTPRRSRIR